MCVGINIGSKTIKVAAIRVWSRYCRRNLQLPKMNYRTIRKSLVRWAQQSSPDYKSPDPEKKTGSIWLYKLIRWSLSLLFIWAGSIKLADIQAFAVVIRDFGIVPEWSIMPTSITIPTVEIIAAIGLAFDIRGSLAIISGLLLLFMAILGYGIRLGLDIDCGCFGPEDPEYRAYHSLRISFYRDLIMAGGIMYLYWWRSVNTTVSSVLKKN